METVYLVSGPIGVGKSTTARALSEATGSSLIVGDDLYNLEDEQHLEWTEKLQKGWDRVLEATQEELDNSNNVVIDFVVEDELPWFMKELSVYSCKFIYVVLLANKETILERLRQRDDLKYQDRSMVLLEQLSKDPFNEDHIIDTTNKDVPEIVEIILNSPSFAMN